MNQHSARKVIVVACDSEVVNLSADLAIQVRFGHFYPRGSPRTETEKFVALQKLLGTKVIVLLLDPERMFRSRSNPSSIREVKVQHFVDGALQRRFDGRGFESSVQCA